MRATFSLLSGAPNRTELCFSKKRNHNLHQGFFYLFLLIHKEYTCWYFQNFSIMNSPFFLENGVALFLFGTASTFSGSVNISSNFVPSRSRMKDKCIWTMILNLSGMEFLSLFTNLSASVWRRRTAGVDISYAVRQMQKNLPQNQKDSGVWPALSLKKDRYTKYRHKNIAPKSKRNMACFITKIEMS